MNKNPSHDANEILKFNNLAHAWWNLDGEFKTLHHINPTRIEFISRFIKLEQKHVIDVGCGGGILSESMANLGAHVTGIDLAPQSIEVAKLHLYETNLKVDYRCVDIADIADSAVKHNKLFDIVTNMEMLEHVPNPELIIQDCARLLKTGGYAFFSTLNRNIKSYTLSILLGEYVCNLIPRGTHDYQKFIKPSELREMLSKYNLQILDIKGLSYNPLNHTSKIINDVSVNYMIACVKI